MGAYRVPWLATGFVGLVALYPLLPLNQSVTRVASSAAVCEEPDYSEPLVLIGGVHDGWQARRAYALLRSHCITGYGDSNLGVADVQVPRSRAVEALTLLREERSLEGYWSPMDWYYLKPNLDPKDRAAALAVIRNGRSHRSKLAGK